MCHRIDLYYCVCTCVYTRQYNYCDKIVGTSSAQPALQQLLGALQQVSAEWYTLGIQLGYDADTLNIISANNFHKVEHCLRDLLSNWRRKYPNKGWSDIISALRKMGRNDIANDVERQYLSSSLGMV